MNPRPVPGVFIGDAVWDLTGLYPGLGSAELRRDLQAASDGIKSLRALAAAPVRAADWLVRTDTARCTVEGLLADLQVYGTAVASVGGPTAAASAVLLRQISALSAELARTVRSLETVVAALDRDSYAAFLAAGAPGAALRWGSAREQRSAGAGEPAEQAIVLFGAEAYRAWSNLYEQLAGELVVAVPAGETSRALSIAEAVSLLVDIDGAVRQAAWTAIRQAWEPHETTVAAILSNLASYRLKQLQLRSGGQDGADFLVPTLAENRLSRSTLDSLMTVLDERRPRLQQAVRLMARLLGKPCLDPWDLAASCGEAGPDGTAIPLGDALAMIRSGFDAVDASMGDFVARAQAEHWIDARPHAQGRRLGAFQTSVRRGRHPLVFANYLGRRLDVVTLAHELGHAYHYWLLRDEPAECHRLPATLSECVSSFAEMQVRGRWHAACPDDPAEQRFLAWAECQSITAFLINMPASFTFEQRLYPERRKGAFEAAALRRMLDQSWQHWFGSTLSAYDDRGWVRKPHFASTHSFYNYPYIVGYLVAVMLQDYQARLGPAFFNVFRDFARDTAYLSVDALLMKYFALDQDKPAFWRKALDLVEQLIARATALAGAPPN